MSERNEIFHAIQEALAGHSEREGIAALISSLVVAIGVSSETYSQAINLIDTMPEEMKRILQSEWSKFRRHREKANLRRAAEEAGGFH